jgi:hypothetical protein
VIRVDVHNHGIPREALGLLREAPEYRVRIENDR